MSFKGEERRKDSKYICIKLVALTFLFTTSGFPHLFLWIQVTIWHHFLNTILYIFTPTQRLCAVVNYITFLYVIGTTVQLYTYCFIQHE